MAEQETPRSAADTLQLAVKALETNPAMSDEDLAQVLGFARPASARFWKLKAREILAQELDEDKEEEEDEEEEEEEVRASVPPTHKPRGGRADVGAFVRWMWAGLWTDRRDDGQASAPVRRRPRPSAPPTADALPFFEDDLIEDEEEQAAPLSHFERYRTLIDSFDEERETWLEKLLRWLLLLMAYVLPLLVAYAMGKEIGDAYGGVFNLNDGWSLGTHVVAMAGEFALTMMTFSAASALRKMATDGSYAGKFAGSVIAFLLFALASGLAQWFIAAHHISPSDLPGRAALVFRVAMVPAVDIASLLFLAVMNFKSLKKFVADQRLRAQAIRDLNEAELEIQRAQSTARRRETEEQQDMEMKEQRNAVWLELDRLHAQSMIGDAKRRALPPAATTVTPDDAPTGLTAVEEPEQVRVRRIDRSSRA